MRINTISQSKQSFTGLLNNKLLLKGLEQAAEHGTSFSAGASLVLSLGLRPFAIMAAPDTEKENKQYAVSNSVCSGIAKFAIVEAVALPVENAVKKIDNNPYKYLKPETIKIFKGNSVHIADSKSYKLATQILKLGTGFVTAIPKSMLTIAFIPIIMDKLFTIKKNEPSGSKSNKNVSFGNKLSEGLSNGLGRILDSKLIQKFGDKYSNQERNIAKHMTAATDILLTVSSAVFTHKSKEIKENRKKALIYNNIISTMFTLTAGYGIDNIIKSKTGKFIEKFSKINAADPKLHKYIEGINIIRPALIFAVIYYGILPIFSTYTAEKTDKYIENVRKN